MCTPNIVMSIANCHIERVIFVLTGGDGDCSLVTAEYQGYECAAMCVRILRNHVLVAKAAVRVMLIDKW